MRSTERKLLIYMYIRRLIDIYVDDFACDEHATHNRGEIWVKLLLKLDPQPMRGGWVQKEAAVKIRTPEQIIDS